MADNFFKQQLADAMEPQTEEVKSDVIKLGDKEYTPDQLAEFVGLAEKVKGLETQWSTKIDRLMPEYTKKSQEAAEYRKKLDEIEQSQLKQKTDTGAQLSPEETAKQVKAELAKYGVMFKEEFAPNYSNQRAAERLIDDAQGLIEQAAGEGKPKTTLQDLLGYMDENGIKSPDKAYKLMFESELDQWKEKQLRQLKQTPMITQTQSSAGSKSPAPTVVTRQNLSAVLSDFLASQGT